MCARAFCVGLDTFDPNWKGLNSEVNVNDNIFYLEDINMFGNFVIISVLLAVYVSNLLFGGHSSPYLCTKMCKVPRAFIFIELVLFLIMFAMGTVNFVVLLEIG